jgi:hypothetical protein
MNHDAEQYGTMGPPAMASPGMPGPPSAANNDAEHLRLLSIFYYINTGLVAFYSMFALMYVAMGGFMLLAAPAMTGPRPGANPPVAAPADAGGAGEDGEATGEADEEVVDAVTVPLQGGAPPFGPGGPGPTQPSEEQVARIMGAVFLVIGLFLLIIGLMLALAQFLVGRFLGQRKHHTFCLVVAGLNCRNMPLGTILGVFTFIVLLRPSVKRLFEPSL